MTPVRATPLTTRPARTIAGLTGATALTLSLAACGGGSGAAGPASTGTTAATKGGASHVKITMSNTGGKDVCTLDHATAKAGPVTFTVTNKSSTALTEVELMSASKIIGEKENLAPGLDPVSFTTTLGGGKYQVYCPGAAKELTDFTVTGKASASPTGSTQTVLTDGATQYKTYVTNQVSAMVTAVQTLQAAVDSGDVAKAQAAYGAARPFYERIESDVDGFVLPGHDATDNSGNLDYLIDMRGSNLDPAVGWHGFHAVERDLWSAGGITDSTRALAAELTTNVTQLQALSTTLTYKPEDLANGAASLLEEVQSSKIKGEEEAFSHTDLVDFAANVEGAQQAFAYLEPGLTKIDPVLVKQIQTQFASVTTALDAYRDATAVGGYRTYTPQLRASDAATLSQKVQALQDPLAGIAEKVATAN